VVFFCSNRVLRSERLPNTACTRLVGVAAFFRQFLWLGVGSVKAAFSRPAHQRVTPAVRRLVFQRENLNLTKLKRQEIMQSDISTEEEKSIVNRQFKAFFVGVSIFVLSAILSRVVFHTTMRYGVLLTILPMFYIAISSMKNRVSILRLKGQKEYSRGQQAFIFGIIILIVEIATFIFFLTPLSDKYVNF
jgi:heme/copper-type cytochrome/quinol oxidase subunit 4